MRCPSTRLLRRVAYVALIYMKDCTAGFTLLYIVLCDLPCDLWYYYTYPNHDARSDRMNKVTPKQRQFVLNLIDERQITGSSHDEIVKMCRISEDPEELGMTKQTASEVIDWLLKQPKVTRAA